MAASRPKRAAGLLAAARIAKGDGGQRQKRVLAMEPPAPGAPRLRGAAEAPCTDELASDEDEFSLPSSSDRDDEDYDEAEEFDLNRGRGRPRKGGNRGRGTATPRCEIPAGGPDRAAGAVGVPVTVARGRPGAAAGAVPAAAGGAGLPHRGTAAERLATQQQPRKGLGWPPTGAPGRATPKVPTAVASKQPSPACAEDAQQNDDEEGFVYPDKVQVGGGPSYRILLDQRLGKGGFGQVYKGEKAIVRVPSASKPVAVKFEHKTSKGCSSSGYPYEWTMYRDIRECYGIPKLHWKGVQGDFFVMVMDLLGPSLWDRWNKEGQKMPEQLVACIAVEALTILECLHTKGFVHGDIKPENFLMGAPGTPAANRLFLVDLGLATRWKVDNDHVKYDQKPDDFRGTVRYASVHAHLGRTASRRDDLESLAYTLQFLLKGRLPWQGFQGDNKGFQVSRKKMQISADKLCHGQSAPFRRYCEAAMSMRFDEEPKYDALIALFEPLVAVSASQRPITIAQDTIRVGMKRGRTQIAELDLDETGGARKKMRQGVPTCQWITVYNAHSPMKQRYHYNVSPDRLDVHVRKGWADRLHITSVGSCQGLWALIMDSNAGYTAQTYQITSQFLSKEWIMEKWDAGFYITAVAGADGGRSLVVMSKGTKFTQQSYKVSESFPFEWIKKKWREGFHVTAMTTSGAQWAVVMSRNSGYSQQCVELDFQYSSEGIHMRWDEGYRITSCGATPDQSAFMLSIPRRPPTDEVQETLRTTNFPCTHVKEKWDKNMYIAAIAYGRTVS